MNTIKFLIVVSVVLVIAGLMTNAGYGITSNEIEILKNNNAMQFLDNFLCLEEHTYEYCKIIETNSTKKLFLESLECEQKYGTEICDQQEKERWADIVINETLIGEAINKTQGK